MPAVVLSDLIHSALAYCSPPCGPSQFRFDWTMEAALHNQSTLAAYDFDFHHCLASQPFSATSIGSEFRPIQFWAPLCSRHPLWPRARTWLSTGVHYPLHPISDSDRKADNQANLLRGNHKSALHHQAQLISMLQDEVSRGWQLLLPLSAIHQLPGAVLAPLGMVQQTSINELGQAIPKWRLTHDQSFNAHGPTTRRSVNDRVIHDSLSPCLFGHALQRYIHHLLHLRQCRPMERIFQTKVDFKSAYRRLHYNARTAVQSLTTIDGFLLLALRMTFGGSPNPSQWSDISELMCDLANDLVRHPGWDHISCASPHHASLASQFSQQPVHPTPAPVPALAQTLPLAIQPPNPTDTLPKADCYIDDLFSVMLESDASRGAASLPFVLHLLGRPQDPTDALTRDDLLSLTKFKAEAAPTEQKTILGWHIDTHSLIISLPSEKFRTWSGDLAKLINHPHHVPHAQLEAFIGRMNHAAHIIPLSRHFLGRLRTSLYAASRRGWATLRSPQLADLRLWQSFLQFAHQGISLNLLSFRLPSHILRSDACEHGLGGFSATTGIAWRWELPVELRLRATLNSLEFLATYINAWMECHLALSSPVPPCSILLLQSDSSSAVGWLHRSNFDDSTPLHFHISRAHAHLMLSHGCGLYSQWFPGAENLVADSLSRDFHLGDSTLLNLLHLSIPLQLPPNFRLCPLPPELLLQVTTWLQALPASTQLPKTPQRSKLATGTTSRPSSLPSTFTTIHISPTLPAKISNVYLEPLLLPTVPVTSNTNTLHNSLLHHYLAQSAPPSMLWHRPTGLTNVLAPAMTP